MQLVCIAGYCLNCSFNRDDRNTRKCNVPAAYFDGNTQLMVVHGTRSNEIYFSVAGTGPATRWSVPNYTTTERRF